MKELDHDNQKLVYQDVDARILLEIILTEQYVT